MTNLMREVWSCQIGSDRWNVLKLRLCGNPSSTLPTNDAFFCHLHETQAGLEFHNKVVEHISLIFCFIWRTEFWWRPINVETGLNEITGSRQHQPHPLLFRCHWKAYHRLSYKCLTFGKSYNPALNNPAQMYRLTVTFLARPPTSSVLLLLLLCFKITKG